MVSLIPTLPAILLFSLSVFADYPASFHLTGQPDTAHTVSNYISAEAGGALETVDGLGNIFRLRIPANALTLDTVVTLMPLQISGLPGQTAHIGVDISPAGTQLNDFAILEVLPATANFKNSYWLETTGNANTIEARPGFSALSGKAMLLSHFSGGSIVTGGAQVSGSIQNGVFDGTASWFEWQRNAVKQDFDSGRIDQITYDAKVDIITRQSQAIIQKQIQDMMNEAQVATAQAIESARQHTKGNDIKNIDAFLNDFAVATRNMKKNEIMGYPSKGYHELVKILNEYILALYANCENSPLGATLFYRLERMRQLSGAPDANIDIDQCINGAKIYRVSADYVFKYKQTPTQARYIDNVKKHLDFSLRVVYKAPDPTIVAEIVGSHDAANSYENHYDPTPYFGEGCKGTQTPIGQYEIFGLVQTNVQAFYNPGFQFPPGVPVPPGYPETKPSGSIQIQISGQASLLGWKFTSDFPSCAMTDIPPKNQETSLFITFDPTKIEKKGEKIVESHRSEDQSTESGWIYTIQRVH